MAKIISIYLIVIINVIHILSSTAYPCKTVDINGDDAIDLEDVVQGLKVLTGLTS